ncbi:MAG: DUF6335 family protein [Pyrinomonadaceae bacterium]
MSGNKLEFYAAENPVNGEMKQFIDDEIAHVPQAPSELRERLAEHHSSSPRDSGGDIDAQWEEVNSSGSESVFGHNPTPDQSDVEENAHAMGIDFADDEPLDFEKKLSRRDHHRFEMNESSKTESDMI